MSETRICCDSRKHCVPDKAPRQDNKNIGEIGPSGVPAGPLKQILTALYAQGPNVQYCTALSRGQDSIKSTYDVAGRLSACGGYINLAKVNQDISGAQEITPSTIVDLPITLGTGPTSTGMRANLVKIGVTGCSLITIYWDLRCWPRPSTLQLGKRPYESRICRGSKTIN